MPELVTYLGRPVKRRERVGNSLKLIFVSPNKEERGSVLFVSQADWQTNGKTEFFDRDAMPNVRELAKQFG